jgi:hypothetical protein
MANSMNMRTVISMKMINDWSLHNKLIKAPMLEFSVGANYLVTRFYWFIILNEDGYFNEDDYD